MKKEDKYEQNIDYESYLSDDCLQDFLRIIKRNKAATKEENKEMFLRYKNGDVKVKDMIVEKNLNLVVSVVFRIGKNLNSDKKLEYIQSGIIGLIEAVDTFDLSMGTAFSTHAEYQIQMRINRYRYNKQHLIRRPEYLEVALGKYRKLLREYEKMGKPLPPKNEICTILDISDSTLKKIEENYKLDATSLDAPVNNDDQNSEDLGELIGNEEKGFGYLIDKIVYEEILKTIKMNTNKYEYFIFYYRTINSEQKTLKELADYFGVTQEAIRRMEAKVKSRVRKMFTDDYILKRTFVDKIKMKYSFENIKIIPCPMENYTMYFFLKDRFTKKDQIILREMLIGDFIFDCRIISTEIMESKEYVKNKSLEIDILIKKATCDIRYNLFHNNLIKNYKNKIYLLDLDSDLSDCFDIRKIVSDYWHDKTIDEIFELASVYNLSYKERIIEKLRRFYGIASKKEIYFNKECLERDVNYSLFGFAIHEMSFSKLYPTFLENQYKFTDKQREYLNIFVFKKEKIPPEYTNYYMYTGTTVIDKLILLYYKIEDYKKDNFDYKKYKTVRSQYGKDLGKRSLMLLDFYYGINGNCMTIKEMANFLHEEEEEIEKDFRKAKNNAIAIYLGTSQYSFERDREIYSSILEDENFTLGNPHLQVAKMFFLERKSYEEIANEFEIEPKFTQRKVSDLIKYACSVMDYYRFGITSTKKNYSKEFLLSILEESKYDEETKRIMHTYIENESLTITAKIYQKNIEEINNIIRRLNNFANKVSIKQVELTKEDVEIAVMQHDSTNVLNERERIILSLTYGLKNKYNMSGKRMYPIDIGELLGIKNNIGSVVKGAKEHAAAHKIGLLKTAIDFINREELENVIRDLRLPLTEDDKNIIINAYGLYNTEYLTIKELAKKYGIKEQIVRNRIYKGIVTIKKYLNKEIVGNVLFEIDIEPYLKYFILEDREILTLLYQDRLTQVEIEKRYGFSTHQFEILLQKMRMHLSDLQSGLAIGIDFDYFWTNALEKDIPYYGNQQLAVKLCFLYYEKRLSQSDIIKYHYPKLSESSVSELIRGFTAAVIKHQIGIRKANEFSYEEIADYYNRHKDDLGVVSTKLYRNYFVKIKRNGPYAKVRPNKSITYDLIKEKYPDYFRLENTSPNQVKEILKNYGHTMSKETIQILESLFGVTHANMLSDEDWEDIINFLGPLQLINEKDNQLMNKNMSAEDSKISRKRININDKIKILL